MRVHFGRKPISTAYPQYEPSLKIRRYTYFNVYEPTRVRLSHLLVETHVPCQCVHPLARATARHRSYLFQTRVIDDSVWPLGKN
jgi:hypothetical protein